MLVLSRKIGEKIVVADNITITITKISGNRVSVGIDAPSDVHVVRGELEPAVRGFSASLSDHAEHELVGAGATILPLPTKNPVSSSLRDEGGPVRRAR